jgi:LCP family protein required for cell wall assembly
VVTPQQAVVLTPAATSAAGLSLPFDVLPSPTVNPLDTLPNWDQKDRVNILLLGVDSNPARLSTGEPPLSDTMIIVSINPATKTVGMLSIPRDLLVTIPNYGQDKINAAFADGEVSGLTGPALVRATIEYNFHVPIHYFAEVDLAGFQKIVDTLGGVTIDVQAPLKDDTYPGDNFDYTRFVFQTGLQHMDGQTALHYARSRHDDSDFGRGDRQQQVLRAIREQATSLGLIAKAPQLVDQLGGTFKTDLSLSQVLALAKLAAAMPSGNIMSYNLLAATTVQWLPGQPYYLIPQWPAIQQILNDINSR